LFLICIVVQEAQGAGMPMPGSRLSAWTSRRSRITRLSFTRETQLSFCCGMDAILI